MYEIYVQNGPVTTSFHVTGCDVFRPGVAPDSADNAENTQGGSANELGVLNQNTIDTRYVTGYNIEYMIQSFRHRGLDAFHVDLIDYH